MSITAQRTNVDQAQTVGDRENRVQGEGGCVRITESFFKDLGASGRLARYYLNEAAKDLVTSLEDMKVVSREHMNRWKMSQPYINKVVEWQNQVSRAEMKEEEEAKTESVDQEDLTDPWDTNTECRLKEQGEVGRRLDALEQRLLLWMNQSNQSHDRGQSPALVSSREPQLIQIGARSEPVLHIATQGYSTGWIPFIEAIPETLGRQQAPYFGGWQGVNEVRPTTLPGSVLCVGCGFVANLQPGETVKCGKIGCNRVAHSRCLANLSDPRLVNNDSLLVATEGGLALCASHLEAQKHFPSITHEGSNKDTDWSVTLARSLGDFPMHSMMEDAKAAAFISTYFGLLFKAVPQPLLFSSIPLLSIPQEALERKDVQNALNEAGILPAISRFGAYNTRVMKGLFGEEEPIYASFADPLSDERFKTGINAWSSLFLVLPSGNSNFKMAKDVWSALSGRFQKAREVLRSEGVEEDSIFLAGGIYCSLELSRLFLGWAHASSQYYEPWAEALRIARKAIPRKETRRMQSTQRFKRQKTSDNRETACWNCGGPHLARVCDQPERYFLPSVPSVPSVPSEP